MWFNWPLLGFWCGGPVVDLANGSGRLLIRCLCTIVQVVCELVLACAAASYKTDIRCIVVQVTHDISHLTCADVFRAPGVQTPVITRFSTVIHERGSPETLRDPRGFAVKFYTREGNWDLVGNNMPVFFIRDGIKFPDMIHALKPNPKNHIQEDWRIADFFSHVPEAMHMVSAAHMLHKRCHSIPCILEGFEFDRATFTIGWVLLEAVQEGLVMFLSLHHVLWRCTSVVTHEVLSLWSLASLLCSMSSGFLPASKASAVAQHEQSIHARRLTVAWLCSSPSFKTM